MRSFILACTCAVAASTVTEPRPASASRYTSPRTWRRTLRASRARFSRRTPRTRRSGPEKKRTLKTTGMMTSPQNAAAPPSQASEG